MSDRSYTSGLPAKYAEEKLSRLTRRWGAEFGEHLRAMTPVAWPGVPPTFFLGFTGFARGTENTTDGVPAQRFHEVGYFQVEAGLRDGAAPNPDPTAEYNAWGRLHASDLVVQLLGHPATMSPNGWREDIAAQCAVGLANLKRHLGNARSKLPVSLHPVDPASTWAGLLAFTAFSRGAGQLAKVIAPYAAALAKVDEHARWDAWQRLVVADINAKVDNIGTRAGKSGTAYALIRSRQKHDCGRLAASTVGEPVDWYLTRDDAIDDTLTRRAYGA